MNERNDTRLDELLQAAFEPVSDDDDFSRRVMEALPKRAKSRAWVLPVACTAGAIISWTSLSHAPIWRIACEQWQGGSPGSAVVLACAAGFVVGALALGWAVEQAD